ncbi:NAD(P)H-dependent oxidoreductase subunit E [Maricaulis sp.]|uniref:NAD(P)H-dependent oxidoreductase subunit E n=1 Tax=Maricaulis sp. TaxID=1486257 RepID=UPI0025BACCA7|nr:NAD(P)H-dependent oxidoreductase subunit E [Maricaulis sp.]
MPMLIDTIEDRAARAACERQDNRPDALIEILHDIQATAGFISDAAIATLADALNRSRAEILGVVSFYHDFTRQPGAPHTLKLCRAEACQAAGGDHQAAEIERRLRERGISGGQTAILDIKPVYCVGNCALGPAALLDGTPVGRIDADRIVSTLVARGIIEADQP